MKVETVSIDLLVPYWRNPRKNDLAVEKVKESIKEFGYQVPIIVDNQMTIVAGHTRYRAMKELGFTEVPILITDLPAKKIKEFRIIDNRTSEYAQWTNDLEIELKEFTTPEFREIFFPDIKLDPDFIKTLEGTDQETINTITADLEKRFEGLSEQRDNQPKMVFPCPHCLETITLWKADVVKERSWTF